MPQVLDNKEIITCIMEQSHLISLRPSCFVHKMTINELTQLLRELKETSEQSFQNTTLPGTVEAP